MKAILIDDEPLALLGLELALHEYPVIEIVGKFQRPLEAIEFVKANADVEVVFLDIHMPTMKGLIVAEKLQECAAEPHIVFVTAYHFYAIEAFELHALDYILKPLDKERLSKTIDRLIRIKQSTVPVSRQPSELRVTLMGQLQFIRPNGEYIDIKWRTTKTQELMAYLLIRPNEYIHRDQLLELLWPDVHVDKVMQLLYTTVYYLRSIVKKYKIPVRIEYASDCYRLQATDLQRDIDYFQLPEQQRIQGIGKYTGDLLQEHGYWWTEQQALRLRKQWVLDATVKVTQLVERKRYEQAISWYDQLTQADPYTEKYYHEWMNCCKAIGNPNQVDDVRRRMIAAFQEIGLEIADEHQQST